MISTGALLGFVVLLVLVLVQHARLAGRLDKIEARQRFSLDLTMTWAANWGADAPVLRAALERIIARFNGN